MKRLTIALICALPFVLAACGKSPSTSLPTAKTVSTNARTREIPAVQEPNMAAARKYATGFEVGNPMTPHQVFVFFDPQCPHCGQFWKESKTLYKDAHFTWVPVAVLNRESVLQAAAILSSKSPSDMMNEHEEKLLSGAGGLKPTSAAPKAIEDIERNTRLLESFGATGVPYIVSVNKQSGKVFAESHGIPPEKLLSQLGVSAIAGPGK